MYCNPPLYLVRAPILVQCQRGPGRYERAQTVPEDPKPYYLYYLPVVGGFVVHSGHAHAFLDVFDRKQSSRTVLKVAQTKAQLQSLV